MKSKKLVIIASVVAILSMGTFVGVYFYAKSLVTPQKVREMSLTFLKKTFPKSNIELGKTEISFGLSIKVNVDSLSISSSEYKLASLKNLTIDVPIFSILTGGGDLTVSLNSPNIHYIETKSSNNWQEAMAKPGPSHIKKSKKEALINDGDESSKAVAIGIPSFLLNSTASLDVKNLILDYQLKNKSKGSVALEKVFLKKIGIKNSSAYEVSSKINYEMESGEKLSFDALLIGQFNLTEIISKQRVETVSVLKINNMNVPGIKSNLPEIKADIKSVVEKSGKVYVDTTLTFLDSNRLSLKLHLDDGQTRIEGIDTSLSLKNLLDIAGVKMASLDPRSSSLELSGSLNINKKGIITPDLKFSLGPNLTYVDKNFTTKTTLSGSLIKKSFTAKAEAKVLDGTVIFQNVMELDLNNPPSVKNIPKSNTLINIHNLSITEKLIQEILYSSSENKAVTGRSGEVSTNGPSSSSKAVPIIPPGNLTVKMNNVKIGTKLFNLESKINLSPRRLEVKDTSFNFSNGKGSSSAIINLEGERTSGVFDFKLDKFDLIGLKPFLPRDVLSAVHGTFSGTANGKFEISPKSTTYDVLTNVKASDGEINGLNIGSYVKPILNSIPKLGEKYAGKEIDVDGKFSSLSVNGRFQESSYKIKSTRFVDSKKSLEITGNGNISPNENKKSDFFVNYKDLSGKVSKVLTKEIGTDTVPLKLSGKGFSLTPDVEYTLKKVSKTAVKVQAKKQIKKLLNDDGKKKINKLLKGLFN